MNRSLGHPDLLALNLAEKWLEEPLRAAPDSKSKQIAAETILLHRQKLGRNTSGRYSRVPGPSKVGHRTLE
jgi:hypothetical protein